MNIMTIIKVWEGKGCGVGRGHVQNWYASSIALLLFLILGVSDQNYFARIKNVAAYFAYWITSNKFYQKRKRTKKIRSLVGLKNVRRNRRIGGCFFNTAMPVTGCCRKKPPFSLTRSFWTDVSTYFFSRWHYFVLNIINSNYWRVLSRLIKKYITWF